MKPEEVLKILDSPFDEHPGSLEQVTKTIIQSLEKQIAKKPRYYVDMYGHNRPGCPGCPRNEILYAGQKYCKVCGTKIDWSDPKHD